MRYLIYIFVFLLASSFNIDDPLPEDRISYWESKEKNPTLAQIIISKDDQGRDVLHINLYLSTSCTTRMYYAMPIDEANHYVLTDTGGKIIDASAKLIIKRQKKLKLNKKTYVRINSEKYFKEMKRFEKIKRK